MKKVVQAQLAKLKDKDKERY